MNQQITVLMGRLTPLSPAYSFGIDEPIEWRKDPSLAHSPLISVRLLYGTHAVVLGALTNLMWMNDQELREMVQKHVEDLKAKDAQDEKLRRSDPLFGFKKKMASIGWEYAYRFTIAQVNDEQVGYKFGDTLLSVQCHDLTTMDQYVIIGPLHYLVTLAEHNLREAIKDQHTKAIRRALGKSTESSLMPWVRVNA
jgi:hypothetical protein